MTGCTKVSLGCRHCWVELYESVFRGDEVFKPAVDFDKVVLHEEALTQPGQWWAPSMVLVNSKSDTFHENVPTEFIKKIFSVMESKPQHIFEVLTKRSDRLAELAPILPWPSNVWCGVTVEHADYLHRIDNLRTVPAALRYLALEPLLSPMPNLNLEGIHWVMAGGELGPETGPVPRAWVLDVRDQCVAADIPFLFRFWGGEAPDGNGCLIEGKVWGEMP